MESVTLIIATVAGILVFVLCPVYSIVVYIAALAWYPSYLTIKLGTIDFTVSRIVILAIYANLFVRTSLSERFKLVWLDKMVIIFFLCKLVAGSVHTEVLTFLEMLAGQIFDQMLPYFAIRMIIGSKKDYLTLLKGVLIVSVPLAVGGFWECMTGSNIVGFLKKYHAFWEYAGYTPKARYGFFRAEVTFPMSIMYGLYFSMFGPICAGILHNAKRYKILCWIGLGLMGIGVFSSMSSGPMLAAILSILFIVFYRWRKYWKPVVIMIIIICGLVEIMSNRHFYDVLGGFTLNSGTAWYRSRLIDVALFEGGMSGHWIVGYGLADPNWAERLGNSFSDVTNHYILILARYGLLGLLPFLGILILAIKGLVAGYRSRATDVDKWLIWCLGAAMFGLLGVMFTVSLFGQPVNFFFMMLALCVWRCHAVNKKSVIPVIVNPGRRARNKVVCGPRDHYGRRQ